MLESTVWGKFYTAWPYHCERNERSGSDVDSGFPDVFLLDKRGMPGLIELKRPDRVILRTSQWAWHERYADAKGKSCVVTCLNNKGRIMWQVFGFDFKKRQLVLQNEWLLYSVQMPAYIARMLRLEV